MHNRCGAMGDGAWTIVHSPWSIDNTSFNNLLNYGLSTMDHGLWTMDYGLPSIGNCTKSIIFNPLNLLLWKSLPLI